MFVGMLCGASFCTRWNEHVDQHVIIICWMPNMINHMLQHVLGFAFQVAKFLRTGMGETIPHLFTVWVFDLWDIPDMDGAPNGQNLLMTIAQNEGTWHNAVSELTFFFAENRHAG